MPPLPVKNTNVSEKLPQPVSESASTIAEACFCLFVGLFLVVGFFFLELLLEQEPEEEEKHQIAAPIEYPDTHLFRMETLGECSLFVYEFSESCLK